MPKTELCIIPRDNHQVSRKLISPSALKVIHRLNSKGYEAFLVGGGVRDILLGNQPKDFDIATSAHPEQVHALFKNSRLIGRRFKLVHILFGREMIEVATFRGQACEQSTSAAQHQTEHGMLLRDNVYGSVEDDAIRRDFTVNALYYSPQDFCVYDYVGGINDIKAKQLQMIGDPETRYREDPVRMLRALRFAAKLNFDIAPQTYEPIARLAPLLSNIPPARLFEEVIKLFMSGYAVKVFEQLQKAQLFESLFPQISQALVLTEQADMYQRMLREGLGNTDIRIHNGKPVTPAFLLAVILWPEVDSHFKRLLKKGVSEFPAMQQAGHIALRDQLKQVSIPKRFSLMMKEIWEFQLRLTKTQGRRPIQLVQQPRFRAAYDFLLLREQAGDKVNNLGTWWTKFQIEHPAPEAPKRQRKPKNSGNAGRRYRNR